MCWKCPRPIDSSLDIFRASVCPECGADLHCCLNCRFYEPGAHYDCHESVDELVKDKERANFCDCFSAKTGLAKNTFGVGRSGTASRTAFDNLFSI